MMLIITLRYIVVLRRRYVQSVESRNQLRGTSNRTKIIAMTLYANDSKNTWGAVRNAQLAPIVFPGWRLRVYVPGDENDEEYSSPPTPPTPSNNRTATWRTPSRRRNERDALRVPKRILRRLRQLGVDLVEVDVRRRTTKTTTRRRRLSPDWWNFLVADDLNVDYFVVRRAADRLDDSDFRRVDDWVRTSERWSGIAGHCAAVAAGAGNARANRPDSTAAAGLNMTLVDGMWGGRPDVLRTLLAGREVAELVDAFVDDRSRRSHTADALRSPRLTPTEQEVFLGDVLGPHISTHCYVSV